MKWYRCNRWRESICLLAGGALSEQESIKVEDHLASCERCRKLFAEMKTVAAPLANWETNIAGLEPSRAAQSRWAKAIHAAGKTNANHRPASNNFFHELWCELIWPCRRALTGIAALWLAMWVINSGMPGSRSAIAMAHSPLSPAMWQSIAEQKQLLAELIQIRDTQPAEPPHRSNPRPRSDRQLGQKIC